MFEQTINILRFQACPAIRYRIEKELLNLPVPDSIRETEISSDERVKEVFSWQNPDGYFGEVFHGGWVPRENRKYSSTGAETGLRFLSEMGVSASNTRVKRALEVLLRDGWNRGYTKWNIFAPEVGLQGEDYIRATVFSYFGIEDTPFTTFEVTRALSLLDRFSTVKALNEIVLTYRGKSVYRNGTVLPEIYHIRLLAFTHSWRNEETVKRVVKAVENLCVLSPLSDVYIRYRSQLIAPARIYPRDLTRPLSSFTDRDWFPWFHTFELLARLGVIRSIPCFSSQLDELVGLLRLGKGYFPIKPKAAYFRKWSVYTGLALEKDWRAEKWKNDLTFRSLLILKYAGVL
jgi:hypothetical protein